MNSIQEFFSSDFFSQLFTQEAMYVVVSLVVIEGLLSVDNALAIAAMASHLDEKKRKLAVTIGYAGAYGFRLVALLIANFIINNPWLMFVGAAYLVWLMCDHFAAAQDAEERGSDEVHHHGFMRTIAMIALLDLSLSFDNVVAAVAFARDNILLVYLGVTIGILTLRLVAGYCIKLLERHPWLEHTAFILVGFVGCLLCVELLWGKLFGFDIGLMGFEIVDHDEHGHYHIEKIAKFGGILVIIVSHILYEKVPVIKRVTTPFLMPIRSILVAIARATSFAFSVVSRPFRRNKKATL